MAHHYRGQVDELYTALQEDSEAKRMAAADVIRSLVPAITLTPESRPGYGFGDAAVALMNGTATPPSRDGGRPIDRPFEHTIQFTP
jgi:hypothetical protein